MVLRLLKVLEELLLLKGQQSEPQVLLERGPTERIEAVKQDVRLGVLDIAAIHIGEEELDQAVVRVGSQ